MQCAVCCGRVLKVLVAFFCLFVEFAVRVVEQRGFERMPGDNEVKAELDLGVPPPEVLEYARKEVNENPETRCQKVSELRDMIYGE